MAKASAATGGTDVAKWDLLRYGLQGLLTAIVLNLKRIMKLVVGVPFKEPARLPA